MKNSGNTILIVGISDISGKCSTVLIDKEEKTKRQPDRL